MLSLSTRGILGCDVKLDAPRILVLNAGYEPLGLTTVRRGVVLVLSGRAEMVSPSREVLRTPTRLLPVPSVVRLLRMVRRPNGRLALSRRNVFRRDRYTCQYCGRSGVELTLDHVVPKSRGGRTTWENLVTACRTCNTKKGNRTPEEAGMRLLKPPRAPGYYEVILLGLKAREFPEEWRDFIAV